MRKLIGTLLVTLAPVVAFAAAPAGNSLSWAYPSDGAAGTAADAAAPAKPVDKVAVSESYTGLPKMPNVVLNGKPLGCIQCHLGNGGSHPELADLAGLSENYIIEQVHAFAAKERVDTRTGRMVLAAQMATEDEIKQAAHYYSSINLDERHFLKTVASNDVPKGPSPFGGGGMRYHAASGEKEPLEQGHVVALAVDDDLNKARDQNEGGGFLNYARPDDLALGKTLATTGGGGKTVVCSTCHGADYKGVGDVPKLAGRQTMYLIRTLKDIQTGDRKDKNAAIMKPVVDKLSDREIVALAAYVSSVGHQQ